MMRCSLMPAIAIGLLAIAPAWADASPIGIWTRDNGGLRVRVVQCGAGLCGVIIREDDKTSPAKVGQRILSGMKQSGANTWKGSAMNPGNGKTYTGTMTLVRNTLTTSGCVLGVICESVVWTRAR
jgi:uncharacterized protein (DUF2147 family)